MSIVLTVMLRLINDEASGIKPYTAYKRRTKGLVSCWGQALEEQMKCLSVLTRILTSHYITNPTSDSYTLDPPFDHLQI